MQITTIVKAKETNHRLITRQINVGIIFGPKYISIQVHMCIVEIRYRDLLKRLFTKSRIIFKSQIKNMEKSL